MGMSTHVVAFKNADEKWHQMKQIWDACDEADVAIPEAVLKYFEYGDPDPAGVLLSQEKLLATRAAREYESANGHGWEIDISKLPPGVTIVRFYNSW